MILKVVKAPNPTLKKVAEPVQEITSDIINLMDNMIETMYKDKGCGLAANQVSVLKRILVIDISENNNDPFKIINPEIKWSSNETAIFKEGCLSFPGQWIDIERPEKVGVSYLDSKGKKCEREVDGILSRCIQHEIDHLNGRLFLDYVSKTKQKWILERLLKNRV